MGYLLDLYITHWNEDWSIGKKAFDMLGLQRSIDWSDIRVWLVHDGSRKFPGKYFSGLPFRVCQVELPHGGIAAARNWCILHGAGEWIKWCDFDDMFAGIYSLRNLTDALETQSKEYDMVWFDMYGEETDGKTRYLKTVRDPVVIHNKCLRRSFLKDRGIRFNEELTWCEDSAFLAVVEMEIDPERIGKVKCEAPIYAWLAREGSLCNREEIRFENAKSFFRRHRYVQDEFQKRGHEVPYNVMTVRIMADSYRVLNLDKYREDTSAHAEEVERYYLDHRKDILKVNREDFELAIRAAEREGMKPIDRDAFKKWLRGITEKHRKDETPEQK